MNHYFTNVLILWVVIMLIYKLLIAVADYNRAGSNPQTWAVLYWITALAFLVAHLFFK